MPTLVIHIPRDSAKPVRFINDPRLVGLLDHGPAQIRRASHIEPVSQFKRLAFRLLRRLFGETGRVADWSRNWPGPWRADMAPSSGPSIGPFRNRQKAIDAEVAWLNDNMAQIHG